MPICFYCKENVGSYGWDKEGRTECIACCNWKIRISNIQEGRKGIIKSKGLKVGDRVKIDSRIVEGGTIGKITTVDRKSTLMFGILEHYLIEYSEGNFFWFHPEDVELVK